MRRAVALSCLADRPFGSVARVVSCRDAFSSRLRSKVAGPPREDDERDDQENDNRHPILQLNAEHREFLNKKLHRAALLLCKVFLLARKIYYFPTIDESDPLPCGNSPHDPRSSGFSRRSMERLPRGRWRAAARGADLKRWYGRSPTAPVRFPVGQPPRAGAACRTRTDHNGCHRDR